MGSIATDPKTLPADIKQKLIAIRDALVKDDINEAYYVLYSIADPDFKTFFPWEALQCEEHSQSVGESVKHPKQC